MRSAINVLVVASFLWLLVSFWNRNELPGSIDYVAGITTRTAVCIALLMII